MKKVKIGEHLIGDGEPCFVIADAGSNHNRDFKMAKELVDAAAEARVDAIKFQTFSAETLYSTKAPVFPGGNETPYQAALKAELPREWQADLAEYARSKGIIFLSTPFDYQAIEELSQIGILAYKWASPEITDLPLLKYAAGKQKPMIISTGMCDLADIREAVDAVRSTGNEEIVLLHCTALYPTKPSQVNLRMMDTMRDIFHLPVGLSDHTLGIAIPVAAVARGACIIEKHFTLNRRLKGPDHPFALEPAELRQMVSNIREVEESLGSPIKKPIPDEEEIARLARRSIIAKVDIHKGTKLTRDMLTTKRPGYGIEPKFLDTIIGTKAKKDIKRDDIITREMIKSQGRESGL